MRRLREELKKSTSDQSMVCKTLREKSKVRPGQPRPSPLRAGRTTRTLSSQRRCAVCTGFNPTSQLGKLRLTRAKGVF